MDDFEEKLNAVLSSPETMDKVMNMARSIGGQSESAPQSDERAGDSDASASAPDMSALLGGLLGGDSSIDPKLISTAMRFLGAYNNNDPQKAALMQAVKPYLRPERRERVDQAMQTLKLANVAKEALGTDMLGNLFGGILGRK